MLFSTGALLCQISAALLQGVLMSNFSRSRRVLSACVPLLHRIIAGGQQPSGLASRHLERSVSTSRVCVREDVGSSPSRLWSRASFARSKFASDYSALAPEKSELIVMIESLVLATPEAIPEIWNDYHLRTGHISAVMDSELYKVMEQRASECPLFCVAFALEERQWIQIRCCARSIHINSTVVTRNDLNSFDV